MRNDNYLKTFSIVCVFVFLVFSIKSHAQTTHTINNPEALSALSTSLGAGDTVILADGTYTSEARIKFSPTTGTAALPITFRAQTPGGVKFTGGLQMDIGGDHVVIDGFHWQGGYGASNFIQFREGSNYANHSTIQNCAIDGLTVSPDDLEAGTSVKHRWIVLYGTYNTVINCSFMNKSNAGVIVLVELQYNAEDNPCAIVGHTISNNYFYKYAKTDTSLTNAGDSETIRIGSSGDQNVNSSITVRNNYFVEADGENEIITNKSKNNTYTNNTFRRCRGSLVLRHGSDAIVDGNYFLGENVEGTGGIRITDSNHTITNNYIQDCITIASQAQWNNGITFLGGGSNNAIACSTTSGISNGYQKVENINLSNNTIINTNAPLYYNTSKGSNDPTGIVENNLIYFTDDNTNVTNVISGDYASLGSALTYTNNVYNGTALGATNAGFSEETTITATAADEIFTFSGTGAVNKGADMGAYAPTTDAMVGYGIGACFLDNLGTNITGGNCTIEIVASLTVGSLPTLASVANSNDVTVTANVSWIAISNDTWITIDISSGTGNETVSVSVTENVALVPRTGSVTFKQDAGGDYIIRTLTVTQDAAARSNLINTGLADDPVTIHSFSKEEVGSGKTNYAANTLDKNLTSVWAADDGDVVGGDYKGDGEYIIYDLGSTHSLSFMQFNTTSKSEAFGIQILVSTTGTDVSDFSVALPISGDLLLTAVNSSEFNQYELDMNARYVKLSGYGRFNTAGNTRTSKWTAVGEIEFYGDAVLSVNDFEFNKHILVYPVPAKENLHFKVLNNTIESVKLFTIQGQLILDKSVETSNLEFSINSSTIPNGTYILCVSQYDGVSRYKTLIISH
jgi:poly(beta-D-mannuronate) lyase